MKGNLTVYKASAGSGKTFTLTAEYVALLLSGEPSAHRSILAVTFTNKATAEMKERILQELWEIAYSRDGVGPFAKAVMAHLPHVSEAQLRDRAIAALHAIIHDYDYFRIETIDAFFQSLLTTLAHELGLSAGFKVEINDRQVVDNAVDRLLATINTRSELLSWVLSYINERIEDNQRWDVTGEVKKLARQIMKERFLLNEEQLLKALDSPRLLRDYRKDLYTLSQNASSQLQTMAAEFSQHILDAGGYDRFSRRAKVDVFINKILSGSVEPPSSGVSKYIGNADAWLKTADKKNPSLVAAAENLANKLGALEKEREAAEGVVNSCKLTLNFLNPLRLIGDIGREVSVINKENNRFMLAKTPLLFDKLVGGADASFVFEKAGTEFRHIMIDEFQDTSTLQWGNFKRLLIENMSQGNSCLLVGDVKQSIYRFRNGDWKILSNIKQQFGRYPITVNNLTVNFRSARNIIAFNNTIFPKAAALLDQLSEQSNIAGIYDDVIQQDSGREGGHVEVCYQVSASKKGKKSAPAAEGEVEEEPQVPDLMAEQMLKLHQNGTAYNDMAVLVRSNRQVKDILDTFAEQYPDIPLISDEAFILSAAPAVQILIHAMRYLADDTDTASLAYVARTYRRLVLHDNCSLTDVAIAPADYIPNEFSKQTKQLRDTPLYELCERLIKIFRLRLLASDAPYLFFFLDELMNYIDSGQAGLLDFLTFWDETLSGKSIPAGEINGVRILTIHKSKGLAFYSVFIPYCDWPLEKDRPDDLLWCMPNRAPYDALPLVPIHPGKAMQASIYGEAYEAEHLDRRTENLNLMYVAFTRAKENLFIWAKAREDVDFLSAELTMGDVLYACTEHSNYVSEDNMPAKQNAKASKGGIAQPANPLKAHPEPLQVSFETYAPHVEFRQSNSAKDFVVDDDGDNDRAQYIDKGKIMHLVFSMIETVADVPCAVERLSSDCLMTDREKASMIEFIRKRLHHPVAKDWFSGRWHIYNECSILSRNAAGELLVRRPDRVMTDGSETVVVDFKFGNPKQQYEEQVKSYCQLLTRMGHSHVKGYLWYVYSGEIKSVL